VALVLVALALRVPWLDALPNPSGDEGNWAWYGFDLYAHRPAALHPDARFVSLAFAWLIAGAYKLLGPSFAAARSVLVAGVVGAMLASSHLARRLAMPRAAVAVAAVLAVHPWAVLWSRTVTVPYALSLSLAVVGPLAWLDALRTRSPWRLLFASQLLGLAMHFSPLALVPIGAVTLWTLAHRIPLRHVPLALSGLAHVAPMLVAGAGVVRVYDGRPKHYFTLLDQRVYVYLRTVLGGLDGESTLRHFTGTQWPLAPELALAALVVALVVIAARPRDDAPPQAVSLARYASLHMALALVGLPLVLAPARPWNLPAIDAERYAFVALAPFALLVGALAERVGRARHLSLALVAWLACVPTARAAHAFLVGGAADRGFYTLAGGGGYRGWKVARERVALPFLIRDEVDRVRRGAPAEVVVADYAWHPLHVVRSMGRWQWGVTDITKFALPVRPGVLHVFVVWSDGLFAPGFGPQEWLDGDARLRALMRSEAFTGLRRVRVVTQPDGAPLFELWAAMRVVGP
jgi:hypothetical protein